MISKDILHQTAIQTIKSQAKAIENLQNFINKNFYDAIELLYSCKGRIIVSGIGKSAIIAQKIVATLNSTGSPSIFLHASEAIHGDLGMVQENDVVICISKSGNSPEIKTLLPIIKSFGNKVIAITGNITSFLAKNATYTLNTTVDEESCPNNLAPTNSTTAQLVMGDCIAVCLMKLRGFTASDFAKYHPGGALGKKLLLQVKDLLDASKKPIVNIETDIKTTIFEISEKRLGVTAVLDNTKLVGIITDGDIRRMLSKTDSITGLKAKDIMTKDPKTIKSTALVIDALNLMEDYAITQLLVADEEIYKGVVHLHDILKEGIV